MSMSRACGAAVAGVTLTRRDGAAAALPTDLRNAPALDQHGHDRLRPGQFEQTLARCGVAVDIVLDERFAVPLQLLAQFGAEGTRRRSEELEHHRPSAARSV